MSDCCCKCCCEPEMSSAKKAKLAYTLRKARIIDARHLYDEKAKAEAFHDMALEFSNELYLKDMEQS